LVGYSGDTGNAKGLCNPHFHFEIAMKKNGNRTNTGNLQKDRLAYKININTKYFLLNYLLN
jgi:murein DD-endopeptidase MepM/ murein hydrolase activator NlpD